MFGELNGDTPQLSVSLRPIGLLQINGDEVGPSNTQPTVVGCPEARLSPDVPHARKMSENVNYSIHRAVMFMPR